MKKMCLKYVALLLTCVIIICTIPNTASATDLSSPKVSESKKATEQTNSQLPPARDDYGIYTDTLDFDNPDTPILITEIESRREENVKHFVLPDGSIEAVVYGNAVHRKDADGLWKDIDNTLSVSYARASDAYTTQDNRVSFSKSYSSEIALMTLNENGYCIAISLIDDQLGTASGERTASSALSTAKITNTASRSNAKTWSSIEEARASVNNSNSVIYSNVKPNVDLEYILDGNDVKENIVVKGRSDKYIYTFELQLSGLTATLQENGNIDLSDEYTKETEYIIPAPYMYDANGEYSYDVYYTLSENKDGTYTLKVAADSDWINDSNRAFPVKIDPSFTSDVTNDTYIDSGNPSSYYGSSNQLWINSARTPFINIEPPKFPSEAIVTNARLYVAYYYYTNVTSNSLTAGAYAVNIGWIEGTLNWNNANRNPNLGISTTQLSTASFSGSAGAYESTPKWVSFDITSAVSSWASGVANNGIALKRLSGTNSSVILKSSEAGSSTCPYISITYTEPRLANGVYKIKNIGTGKYVDVTDRATSSGTQLQQWEGETNDGNRAQLFKVTFVTTSGSTNYYTLRPLTNCGLGMNIPSIGGTATVQTLSTEDSWNSISWNQSIAIMNTQEGYIIKSGNESAEQFLVAPTSGTNGTKLYSSSTGHMNALWTFEQYTTAIDGATAVDFCHYLIPNETHTYLSVMYSSTIGRNGPVTYLVRNEDGTTTNKATINSTTGELTALKPGKVRVGATYSGTSSYWYSILTITEDKSGMYFIKNVEYNNYIQIDNNAAEWNGGEFLELWPFDGMAYQKWVLEYISQGYYKILSTACGLAITSPSALDEKLTQSYYSGSNTQQWRFIEENGTYSIVPKSSINNYMAAGDGILTSNGRNVELRANQTDNKDKWYLVDTKLTLPIRILYDSYVINNYTQENEDIAFTEWIEEQFNISTEPLKTLFNVEFTIVSIDYSSELNLNTTDCNYSNALEWCQQDCGNNRDCATLHHHSGERLLNIQTSEVYYTCRLVGYQLCYWDDTIQEHKLVNGLARTLGVDSLIYVKSDTDTQKFILHELSHNLGAYHCSTTYCAMNTSSMDLDFCNSCKTTIYNGIANMHQG